MILGLIILLTARLFVDFSIVYPLWMLAFLVLISITFCLFGFILGVWADGFERLQVVPSMIVMPLTFLGGSFYGVSDVNAAYSLGMIVLFMLICLSVIWWIFKTGYKIKV